MEEKEFGDTPAEGPDRGLLGRGWELSWHLGTGSGDSPAKTEEVGGQLGLS